MVQEVYLRTGANIDGARKREPYDLLEEGDLCSEVGDLPLSLKY